MKIKATNYSPSEVVKILRENQEMTQKEFAKSINKPYSTYIKYEKNETRYTFETLQNICKKHNLEIIIQDKKK